MWKISSISNVSNLQLWFSDGKAVDAIRGGAGVSSRLIVETQGFIDVTDGLLAINLNDLIIRFPSARDPEIPWVYDLRLSIPGDGSFDVELHSFTAKCDLSLPKRILPMPGSNRDTSGGPCPFSFPGLSQKFGSGTFKPFPSVSDEDAEFLSRMISDGYVPYPDTPGAPGKSTEEIAELGKRFFPFSSSSYELAVSVYDWTTSSFARMVFMKVFEYTSIQPQPFPLDKPSIAKAIWDSNWPPYTPSNEPYMNSFLMRPATSLEDVAEQLDLVVHRLHEFAIVENRVLAAAAASLPRTSVLSVPRLFSGQPDISQLTLSQFGVEFLECPGNKGPVSQPLEIEFELAMKEYIKPGSIITTKMVWSFTDMIEEAKHYSNGLLLVCNPPNGAWVWDAASYVTDLSTDPEKNEYVFAPGTSFCVQNIETEKDLTVITMMVCSSPETVSPSPQPKDASYTTVAPPLPVIPPPTLETQMRRKYVPYNHAHEGKTNGRWCRCVKDSG